MLDWDKIIGFDWDTGNERKNADKDNVSKSQAEQMFFNAPLVLAHDSRHSRVEPRFHALGKTDESVLLHATFTLRDAGTRIRVISVRPMHRKEKQVYEQES